MKFLYIILFPLIIYSQNISVKYEYTSVSGKKLFYELMIQDNSSEFLRIKNQEINNSEHLEIIYDQNFFIIKDIKNNSLISTEFLGKKQIIIKDSLDLMVWDLIENKKKKIIGFECEKAETYFRGRNYIAYYTPEINCLDGPWKFQGLPGLILEINSEDGDYQYSAYEINKTPTKLFQKIAYSENNIHNWDSFKNIFIDYTDKLIKYLRSEDKRGDGNVNYYKIDKPEIIYKEAQIGNGIEF